MSTVLTLPHINSSLSRERSGRSFWDVCWSNIWTAFPNGTVPALTQTQDLLGDNNDWRWRLYGAVRTQCRSQPSARCETHTQTHTDTHVHTSTNFLLSRSSRGSTAPSVTFCHQVINQMLQQWHHLCVCLSGGGLWKTVSKKRLTNEGKIKSDGNRMHSELTLTCVISFRSLLLCTSRNTAPCLYFLFFLLRLIQKFLVLKV